MLNPAHKGIEMFKNFPKVRIPLPLEYQEIYEQMYKSNRNGETAATSLAQKMEKWLHYKVATILAGLVDIGH